MRLPRRFECGVAALAASLILPVILSAHTQNQAPPPAPSGPPAGQASATSPAPSDIPAQPPTAVSHGKHTVTVTFDYDFRQTPACSAKVTKHCVQQFIAYDISAGIKNATMMFPIPLPTHPVGAIHGITATSPMLDFESGKHLVSVSAMSPDGTHSKRSLCTTWITIP
jgi:hypothetical protein